MIENIHDVRRDRTGMAAQVAARVAVAAAVLTPALLAGLSILSPEFDPSYRLISEYALGRYGWVPSLTFLTWGIGTLAAAWTIRPHLRTRAGRVGLAFLVIAGLGQALAAVFDIRHDIMHNLAGAMGMLGLPVAAMLVSISVVRNPEWPSVRPYLLMAANLTWISLVLFAGAFVLLMVTFINATGGLPAQAPPALPHGVIGVVGWANRFLVVVDCAWVAILAAGANRLRPASTPA
jgi:hypothetical membrane protein